jgi:hypothetical protein
MLYVVLHEAAQSCERFICKHAPDPMIAQILFVLVRLDDLVSRKKLTKSLL